MNKFLTVTLGVVLSLPVPLVRAGQEGENEGGGTRSLSAWSGVLHRPPDPPRLHDEEERFEPRGTPKESAPKPPPPAPVRPERRERQGRRTKAKPPVAVVKRSP